MRVSIRGYSMIKRQRSHTRKETEQRAYQPASSTSFGTRDNTSRRPPVSCLVFQQRRLQTTRPYHSTIKPQTLQKKSQTHTTHTSQVHVQIAGNHDDSNLGSLLLYTPLFLPSPPPSTVQLNQPMYELYERGRDEEFQPTCINEQLCSLPLLFQLLRCIFRTLRFSGGSHDTIEPLGA